MKRVITIAVGVFLGVCLCIIVGLIAQVFFSYSPYEQCMNRCQEDAKSFCTKVCHTSDEYMDCIREAFLEECPAQCEKHR